MKNSIARNIGLGLALGLTMFATEAALAQQGKGNSNKNATEVREEQETREKNQNANASRQDGRGGQKDNQGKAKDNSGRAQNAKEQGKSQADNAQRGNQGRGQADDSERGNAYGQNKGDMSGREFGQNRAAEARMTGEQRRAQLVTTVDQGDSKVKEARDRIAKAKDELERNRRSGKMSDAELTERRAAIERAENAVRVLEEKVNAGRARLQ
ncbi:hypothetical protein [uncultured Pontibacter sp.]|uniref:hypothetical protein n=1 Tax=uncultured Pontibacter sp. TaxID=453356 RepID=UPI00260C8EF1|nr:hypothetical protein [uncultured Pontibacter sp.]